MLLPQFPYILLKGSMRYPSSEITDRSEIPQIIPDASVTNPPPITVLSPTPPSSKAGSSDIFSSITGMSDNSPLIGGSFGRIVSMIGASGTVFLLQAKCSI